MDENKPELEKALVPALKDQKVQNSKRANGKILLYAVVAIALLVFFGFTGNYFYRLNKITEITKQIDRQMNTSNYAAAQKSTQEGLRIFPNNKGLLLRLIDSYSTDGNQTGHERDAFTKSKPLIDNALQLHKKDPLILLAAGYAYETAGEYSAALDLYNRAIEFDSTSAIAYFHKGHVLAFLNKRVESNDAYDKAYELNPEISLIAITKAHQLSISGKNAEALVLLVKVGSNDTNSNEQRAEAYSAASFLEMARGNNNLAKQYAESAVASDKTYAPGLGLLGFFVAQKKETYSKGIGYLTESLSKNPRISYNYLLLAATMRAYNYLDEAVALQMEGINRIADDNTLVGNDAVSKQIAKMNYELAQTYSLKGDVSNTIKYLKLAVSQAPTYTSAIEKDMKFGYFSNIKNNSLFSAFIRSI